MIFSTLVSSPDDQAYLVHPGTLSGTSCTFELLSPIRTKTIPYAYLQMIDTREEHLIVLRYSFADVELTTSRNFLGRRQFLDDLANFRVSSVRETKQLRIRILLEAMSEKSDLF